MQQIQMLERITKLEQEVKKIQNQYPLDKIVSDQEATSIVRNFIRERKGRPFDVVILHHETRLPFEQLNRILVILEKDGIVKGDE